MWSHCAERSTGFCLEFDTSFPPFEKVRKVEYVKEIPGVLISSPLIASDFDDILRLYCTKYSVWSYEREWRGIHSKRDTSFAYDVPCLTGVYFGPDCASEIIEIVCLVLKGQSEGVRFYRGRRSSEEFRVTFSPFEYTSYINAKR